MEATNHKNLFEISQSNGNEICVDCKRENWDELKIEKKKEKRLFKKSKIEKDSVELLEQVTTHFNKKLGVFMCRDCSKVHSTLSPEISDVQLVFDLNTDIQSIQIATEIGNVNSNLKYEAVYPEYELRPNITTMHDIGYIRSEFIVKKYQDRLYEQSKEKDYIKRMPESVNELECQILKGKSSWSKVFMLHYHLWIMLFNTPMDSKPLSQFQVSDVISCAPVNFYHKSSEIFYAFSLSYNKGKDKIKNMTIKANTKEEMMAMVMTIRRHMCFYVDPSNHPKIYTIPQVERISNLMIKNSLVKGFLHKRTPRKIWNNRYFAVVGPSLYYFKKDNETKPTGLIPLHNTELKRRAILAHEKKYSFALICQNKTYFFASETEDDMEEWINKLRELQRDYPVRRKFNFAGAPLVKKENQEEMNEI